MKHSAEYYIEHLEMEPHVEGGYFKECLLEKEERNLWSSIYFMLAKGEVSHFHRLKSDEVWYYHDGNALTIYMIDEAGKLTAANLVGPGKGRSPAGTGSEGNDLRVCHGGRGFQSGGLYGFTLF